MIPAGVFTRINVVGTSGCGKSTFSKQLADRLGFPRIELDLLFWGPNWQEPGDEIFFPKISAALDCPCWVLDGNYNRTTSIKWKNITSVIWLDYSFPRVLFQAVRRAIIRASRGNELWPGTGNRETFRKSFFSKSSVLLWTIQSYGPVKARYESIMRDPAYAHIHFIRLKNPKEAKNLLMSLK